MCFGVWEGAARHPSSLYQAATEGALLFGVLWWLSLKPQPKGVLSGAFLLGYGLCRFMTEAFSTLAGCPHRFCVVRGSQHGSVALATHGDRRRRIALLVSSPCAVRAKGLAASEQGAKI